jgi:hypothetical protein
LRTDMSFATVLFSMALLKRRWQYPTRKTKKNKSE